MGITSLFHIVAVIDGNATTHLDVLTALYVVI